MSAPAQARSPAFAFSIPRLMSTKLCFWRISDILPFRYCKLWETTQLAWTITTVTKSSNYIMERLVSVNRAVRLLILMFANEIDDRIDRFLSCHSFAFPYAGGPVDTDVIYLKMQKLAEDDKRTRMSALLERKHLDEEDAKFLRKLFAAEVKVANAARKQLRDEAKTLSEKLKVMAAFSSKELSSQVNAFCQATIRRITSDVLHELENQLATDYQEAYRNLLKYCDFDERWEEQQIDDARVAEQMHSGSVKPATDLAPTQLRALLTDGISSGQLYFDYRKRLLEFLARLDGSRLSDDKKRVLRWLVLNAHETPQPRKDVPIAGREDGARSRYLRRLNDHFAQELGYLIDTSVRKSVQIKLLNKIRT